MKLSVVILGWVTIWNCWNLKACIYLQTRISKMDGMKKNYRSVTEIEEEIKNVDIGNFLDFDDDGKYEFAKCEGFFGPLLGHIEAKFSGKEGVRYGSEALKTCEIWIKRVPKVKRDAGVKKEKER